MVLVCDECAKEGVRGATRVQEVSNECARGERSVQRDEWCWCAMSVQRGA